VLPPPGGEHHRLAFESVRDRPLADIWSDSPALRAYRGNWMPAPCRTCDERHADFSGAVAEAFALVGVWARPIPPARLAPPRHRPRRRARAERRPHGVTPAAPDPPAPDTPTA
jgi:pyrroloquinoline quinone biosynthesis protein E